MLVGSSAHRACCVCGSSGVSWILTAARSAPLDRTRSSVARSTSASIQPAAQREIVDLSWPPSHPRGEGRSERRLLQAEAGPIRARAMPPVLRVGNRGGPAGKAMLSTFQKTGRLACPDYRGEFRRRLMRPGFTSALYGMARGRPRPRRPRCLWRRSRRRRKPSTLWHRRGNFILNRGEPQPRRLSRAHQAYPYGDPASAENVLTVRDDSTPPREGSGDPAFALALRRRRHVALDGCFETRPPLASSIAPRPARPGFGLSGARGS